MLFGVILGTGLWVMLATIFNLITDLVGGVRVTVLEEEVRIVSVEIGESAVAAVAFERFNIKQCQKLAHPERRTSD